MKMTVKDFILRNMTDKNFEKLVHARITENVRMYEYDDVTSPLTEYLRTKEGKNFDDASFHTLHEIEKVSEAYRCNYKEELLVKDLGDLNADTSVWMPTENIDQPFKREEQRVRNEPLTAVATEHEVELELDSHGEPLEDSGYQSFDEISFPFLNEKAVYVEGIEAHEVNESNYQKYAQQERSNLALGLANFIYELLHYSNDGTGSMERSAGGESAVEVKEEGEYADGYCVRFFLDNRTRYLSNETHLSFLRRYETSIPVATPAFVEYTAIWEDFLTENNYVLAPFTDYLYEQIKVPEDSEESVWQVLEQFVHILTLNGFTKEEQVENIVFTNNDYGHVYK
ncbi:hypothetical protein [Halobacillus sp. KGW1]|uniref:hypothetical protein n=1 Tax=Halobacillus sp. KGW1 TaxID=1793726 RepID=UPI0007824DDE|nr:hypothetical protein [Halobacillus sp. KGW1]